jgi:hypothetical protein
MPQLGESPFAPAGYQVWRNVKDYGAIGDGVTDDTAAIQLTISDGGDAVPTAAAAQFTLQQSISQLAHTLSAALSPSTSTLS